ncbi:cAMP-activated global transcriptional regulator CRP [Nitrosococcus oceani]|uniref:Transcriptional regulatory protein, Crp family n=2 Tax=Nitrosococcus oceani TaxID=1229 RepID=Q3JCI1_NITOC|nr:cAMP-activated global transcriptional regulator CRP [Nitrosococcus oceani]KFI20159.1 transcriptional regulator [Nitrosococcus oceani C-27]ABA57465.1 transcriptional regulatory protein, Crp family [Nitrosococcus oceani ATCC 19707]EDZ67047.1 cyclic nucleotide-binding domain protein [Nitrosococcus oceani AFC27]KFI23271.1 transcriptional regulator [Nitrosococcus oceani]GEM21412.1 transcriptional regulator Crp [Nitrosococcus oceani]
MGRNLPLAGQDSIECFLEYCHIKNFSAKVPILRPGDPADTLYYIRKGSATVYIEDEEGNQLILAYLNQGDFIGEMGLFAEIQNRSVLIQARTPCQLAAITYERLRYLSQGPLAEHYHRILLALGRQLTRRLLETNRKVSHLVFMDVAGRVARTLLDLCQQPDAMTHPDGMQIRITRQEISRIVGCSREMAGRVLKELQQQGSIWAKGKTIVVYGTR